MIFGDYESTIVESGTGFRLRWRISSQLPDISTRWLVLRIWSFWWVVEITSIIRSLWMFIIWGTLSGTSLMVLIDLDMSVGWVIIICTLTEGLRTSSQICRSICSPKWTWRSSLWTTRNWSKIWNKKLSTIISRIIKFRIKFYWDNTMITKFSLISSTPQIWPMSPLSWLTLRDKRFRTMWELSLCTRLFLNIS